MQSKAKSRVRTRLEESGWDGLKTVLLDLCSTFPGSQWAPAVAGRVRSRDVKGLLDYADLLASQQYASADEHLIGNQLAALIRKYPFSPGTVPGLNPEAEAMKKFLQSEQVCKRVNRKLRYRNRFRILRCTEGKGYRRGLLPYEKDYNIARAYVRSVLGDQPNMGRVYSKCGFGKGATVGIGGNSTHMGRKLLSEEVTVTRCCFFDIVRAFWADDHLRHLVLKQGGAVNPNGIVCLDKSAFVTCMSFWVRYVDYNKIATVPKDAKTGRTIAGEPTLNSFLQKGIDEEMRYLLRNRAGIDLCDQSRNAELARQGSAGWLEADPYVTLDLSSASDSVTTEICRDLLPEAWYDLLMRARASHYRVSERETSRVYEKMCSMGNGFCFPLETLIFGALAFAANGGTHRDFRVYGDDIVVRRSQSGLLLELLKDAGFRVNVKKSFVFGPFRESCGADWYEGKDVRPAIMDDPLDDIRRVFSLHNSFLRSESVERLTRDLRHTLQMMVPERMRYYRPGCNPGDTAFSVPLDKAMSSPFVKWDREEQCWSWKELLSLPVADKAYLVKPHVDDTAESPVGGAERSLDLVWWYAVLRGSPPDAPFVLRYETKTLTRRKKGWGWSNRLGWIPPSIKIEELFTEKAALGLLSPI